MSGAAREPSRPPGTADVSTEPTADTLGGLSEQSLSFGLSHSGRQHDHLIGVSLGDIRIERLVAEGGMGRVYLGRQHRPARPVAVKFMRHGRSAASLERFHQESEVLGRLSHPGIARVFSAGSLQIGLDDVPYSVMEYIPEAEPLVAFCDAREAAVESRLRLFLQVCDAVAYGHAQGVVHRDLKPGNILATNEGGGPDGRAVVIDYGIAKLLDAEADESVTSTGEFLGTRRYMSPEQLAGTRAGVDARTDVYALGLILHELLTGTLPYDTSGRSIAETARIVSEVRPRPLTVTDPSASPLVRQGLKRIAERCLQKPPQRRYPSAVEVADDVRRLLQGMAVPRRTTAKLPRGVTVGVVLFLLAALIAPLWNRGGMRPTPPSFTGSFVNIRANRTTPVDWVQVSFAHPVEQFDVDSFTLVRDGKPVDLSPCQLEGGPNHWRLWNLTTCNEQAGNYELTVGASEKAPTDIFGGRLANALTTKWSLPDYEVWKLSMADDSWRRHVISMEGLEAYTETDAGTNSFIRPTAAGVEGTMVMKFDAPFEIASAQIRAETFIWTTGDPFPYDPEARSSVEVSPDGEAWTMIDQRAAGHGGRFRAKPDITEAVAGSRGVWVRVRLTGSVEWPGDGLIHSQFMRTHPTSTQFEQHPFILQVAAANPEPVPSASSDNE